MDVERTVREFILKELLYDRESASLADGESFTARGVDSIGLLRLVGFLEETYGIQILDAEMLPENLESIRSTAALVRLKLAADGRN